MIPGLGGMDMRKMGRMMDQLGIKNEDIEASRVVIEKADGSKIIISPASVSKITMQGQDSFQVSGKVSEEAGGPSEEDVKLVAESTGKSSDEAKAALAETKGDIAAAILKLKPE